MSTQNRKVIVRLKEKDWNDLLNLIGCDIAKMSEGDEVKQQMNRICETINLCVIRQLYQTKPK